MINLWLDDWRPAPPGYTHVLTVQAAIELLKTGKVRRASLDHDLGACDRCMKGMTFDEWLRKEIPARGYVNGPHCEHFGTGYTLVCWMEETGIWPTEKPVVHSANPVGAKRMRQVIDAKWRPSQPEKGNA